MAVDEQEVEWRGYHLGYPALNAREKVYFLLMEYSTYLHMEGVEGFYLSSYGAYRDDIPPYLELLGLPGLAAEMRQFHEMLAAVEYDADEGGEQVWDVEKTVRDQFQAHFLEDLEVLGPRLLEYLAGDSGQPQE